MSAGSDQGRAATTSGAQQNHDNGPTLTFIVGAARSGTTWLARALGADPRIAATYETHLFNAYIGPLLATWRDHVEAAARQAEIFRSTGYPPESAIGVPYVMTTDQIVDSLRRFVDDVFDAVIKDRPEALAVVEKTPSHSNHVADIDLLTSGRARYVHIIRSGYEVVESTVHAGAGWASEWAPHDAPTATRKWAAGVRAARQAAQFGDRYLEVRYEDLVAQPRDELLRILSFIGVEATPAEADRALDGTGHGLHLGGEAARLFPAPFPEPEGFRRVDRRDRSDRTRTIVNAMAGDLLSELGYLQSSSANPLQRRLWAAAGRAEGVMGQAHRFVDRARSDITARR